MWLNAVRVLSLRSLYFFFFKCSHLNQFIQHHSIKPRQVLDVVSLHHRPILPDMSSELLHVEDQLSYVSAKHTYTHQQVWRRKCVYTGMTRVHKHTCPHLLVYEIICAFLLDVVCMSKQPDDLITGEWQRHEHKQRLADQKFGGKWWERSSQHLRSQNL